MRSAPHCSRRRRDRRRGAALVFALALLPVFAWLSMDAFMRDQHRMLTGEARAELGDLRDAALKDLGEALSEARADTLKAGETKRIADGVTLTRTVARLQPNKSSDDVAGLSAWLVRTRARSALGDTALRLLFVWRDDGPPENGVWRLANDGK